MPEDNNSPSSERHGRYRPIAPVDKVFRSLVRHLRIQPRIGPGPHVQGHHSPALGQRDRTVIIFTGDNGGLSRFTNNAPLRAGKGYPYEGGIRVPLIIRCPGVVKPGTISHKPVTSVDYLPTVCQLARVAPPDDRRIDGLSLVRQFKSNGTAGLPRDAIYWHFPHYRDEIVPYSIVRSGNWKLIRRYEGKKYEPFNLKDDLSETNDLSENMPEKVSQLDAKLTAWLKSTGAKLPRARIENKQEKSRTSA